MTTRKTLPNDLRNQIIDDIRTTAQENVDEMGWDSPGLTQSQGALLAMTIAAELAQPGAYTYRWYVGLGGSWGEAVRSELRVSDAELKPHMEIAHQLSYELEQAAKLHAPPT